MKRPAKARPRANAVPRTIDDYLARLSDEQRAALEGLRRDVRKVIPEAEECISYQIPTFRLNGKAVLSFGAWTQHCALYPGAIVQDFKQELEEYEIRKGTIRFRSDHPLPASLVRKLVKACVERRLGKGPRSKP